MPKKHQSTIAIIILIVASLLYVYEFYLRVIPSVITQDLMRDLSISAHTLGLVSALFYVSYTFMQIPAGLLVDRFGPRLLLTLATIVCACSTILSGTATDANTAGLSRLIMGFGASFAYACPLLVAKFWFSSNRFAMIGGCVQALGALGAIIGNEPVAYLTEAIGWRDTCTYSGLFGLVLALMIWAIVRDKPTHPKRQQLVMRQMTEKERLKIVMSNHQTWFIAIMGFCYWAPMTVFAELWGRSFITQTHGIAITEASLMMSWVWVGVAAGGPFFGWLSNAINSRKKPIYLSYVIMLITTYSLIYFPIHQNLVICSSLFLFGFASAAQCVTFGLVSDINPKSVVGTAIGLNNMAVIAGGIIIQPLVSQILELVATANPASSTMLFNLGDFQAAFILMPICTLIGLVTCLLFINETEAKNLY